MRTTRREPSASLVRIVAARPPIARGSTTTIPLPPPPLPLPLSLAAHGRPGAGWTLLWPGGPVPSPGQGGRGFFALPEIGAGVEVGRGVGFAVGFVVGFAVGWAVGLAVGLAVGRGVATTGGRPAFVEPGVGVGATATIGPSEGGVEAAGSVDGPGVGAIDGSTDGPTDGGDGSVPPPVEADGVGAADEDGTTAPTDGPGLPIAAIPSSRWVGPTSPAVSATVARIRFRSPMATTRRAR
jgi:hypothetical protein